MSEDATRTQGTRTRRWPLLLAGVVVLLIVGVVIARQFIESFTMGGAHMAPALKEGAAIWVDRTEYGTVSEVKRGDIVAADMVNSSGQEFFTVARVVGLPGDEVEFQAWQVVVNGSPLPQQGRATADDVVVASEHNGEHRYEVRYSTNTATTHKRWYTPGPSQLVLIGDNRTVNAAAVVEFDQVRGRVTGTVIDTEQ